MSTSSAQQKSKTIKPTTPVAYDESSSDAGDYGRTSSLPVPAVNKNVPNVFKPASGRPQIVQTQEPLVKASTKKTDKSRGAYAPVGVPPTLSPDAHSSSEFSEFSDGEGRQGVAGSRHGRRAPDSASDAEQEVEKESRPPQNATEKRKRLIWALVAGGAAVIGIIAIIVTVLLLHSREKQDAHEDGALNSTIASGHSANSTHSTTLHNSTLAANSTSNPSDSMDSYRTALPTNETAVQPASTATEAEDEALGRLSYGSTGLPISTPVIDSGSLVATVVPTQQNSPEASRLPAESAKYEADQHDEDADAVATIPPATETHDLLEPASFSASNAGNILQSTGIGSVYSETPIMSVPRPQVTQVAPNLTPNLTAMPPLPPSVQGVVTRLPPSDTPPSQYLRPAPQVTQPGQATSSHSAEAWWPAPSATPFLGGVNAPSVGAPPVGASPEGATPADNSTKWVGKATWFNSANTPDTCQADFSESDFVVALSSSLRAFCGAKVHIWNEYTNQTRTATVIGTTEDLKQPADINLSKSVFSQLDQLDVGVLDVQWWFEDRRYEKLLQVDLSPYESTAKHDKVHRFQTTAIFWKETGWESKCGKTIDDEAMYSGVPLEIWQDPGKRSDELCGKTARVLNTDTGASIHVEVVEPSNQTDYTTFTKQAFQKLGGNFDDGELAVTFWFD
ncbi:uncharacterized protein JCM15063_001143 [Sporobolomyces koalae]|uniref:uncharacterized protein n=1 Tax=Sporobolomyces koalae TaxID=500713 RepID=UPI003180DC2C